MKFWNLLTNNYKITISIVILLLYLPIINYNLTFFQDDKIIIDNFERINSAENLLNEFLQTYLVNNEYKPITMISYHINALISAQNTNSYYLFNIFILISLASVIYKLLNKFNEHKNLNLFLTLMFIALPLMPFKITWIPGRDILLSSLFGLISFYQIIKYIRKNIDSFVIVSALMLLFSLLSDKTGFSYFILNITYLFLNKNDIQLNSRNKILFSQISIIIIYLILFFVFINFNYSNLSITNNNNSYIINFGFILLDLSKLIILPEVIGAFIFPIKIYNFDTFSIIRIILGFLILLISIILFFIKFRENKILLLGILIQLFAIIPILFITKFTINTTNDYVFEFPILIIIGLLISISAMLANYKNFHLLIFYIFITLISLNINNSMIFKSADIFYNSLLTSNPNRIDYFNKIIDLKIENDKVIDAENLLNNTKININKLDKSYISIANYYFSKENYSSAIPYFEKAILINKNNFNAQNLLANCYFNNSEYEKAIEILLPLAKDPKKFPNVKWDILNIYLKIKDFVNSTKFIQENFDLEKDKVELLDEIYLWSQEFLAEKDNVALVKSLKLGLVVDPENAIILNYLYDTYTKIGLHQKAKEYENKLKEIYNKTNNGKNK